MCSCSQCVGAGHKCKVSLKSDQCGECVHLDRNCKLAVSFSELNYIDKEIFCLQKKK